ncbi:MAG: glutamate--cysteine ligase [Gammaproteobacteria bacterium]
MAKAIRKSLERYHLPEFKAGWGRIRRGIEKESLRISPNGNISQSPHPAALGSALSNPYITTDFSEALLEFITPAYESIEEALGMLDNIHRFTLQNLEHGEILWTSSMPCPLDDEASIPIAQYGSSNIGRLKTLYRRGLSQRYGSLMQVIAGLHYNFSMPDDFWPAYQKIIGNKGTLQDFRTDSYLHLIRNFHRYSWLLLYLFGASPAACKCFVQGRDHSLQELDNGSLFLPNATCLRMGNLGYKSEAQKSLFVCYNDLDTYVKCLRDAMHTPYPPYEEIGARSNGNHAQINTNLLQLENEFYSTIRPKRVVKRGQRPLDALTRSGIEYVEVRALDLNPFLPLGIDADEVRFLDTFLLHCLLSESPECNKAEFFQVGENLALTVEHGRDPELELKLNGKKKKLRDWGNEIVSDLYHAAALLDHVHGGENYNKSVMDQEAKLENSRLTPSGKILELMQQQKLSFFKFGMDQSQAHAEVFRNNGLEQEALAALQSASKLSHEQQGEIERSDTLDFDEFLRQWNAH